MTELNNSIYDKVKKENLISWNHNDVHAAINIYQAILNKTPLQPDALHSIGLLEMQRGNRVQGLTHLKAALEVQPSNPNHWISYCSALVDNQQKNDAKQVLEQGRLLGLPDHAIKKIEVKFSLNLNDRDIGKADLLFNEGIFFHEQKKYAEAIELYEKSIELNPLLIAAIFNKAIALEAIGDFINSERAYHEILDIDPGFYFAHNNLANIYNKKNQYKKAIQSAICALGVSSSNKMAKLNLAYALRATGNGKAAFDIYNEIAKNSKDDVEIFHQLGFICREMDDHAGAKENLKKALALAKDNPFIYISMALAEIDLGDDEQARENLRKAYQLGYVGANFRLAVMLPMIMGSLADVMNSRCILQSEIRKLKAEKLTLTDPFREIGQTNFYLAYHGMNDRDLQVEIADLYISACPELQYKAPHCNGGLKRAKRKIGFFSAFFRNHSVSSCFNKVVQNLIFNKEFEVFIISNAIIEVVFQGMNSESMIQTSTELNVARDDVAKLELDVLIYLDLGMDPMSYFLAFARLANIQMVLGGHPVTTGIPNVDYYLSAKVMENSKSPEHYSEKLVQLDSPLIYFERPVIRDFRKTRKDFGLPEKKILYICPMKLHKMHPDFDVIIFDLLKKDKNGYIVLFEDNKYPWWKSMFMRRLSESLSVSALRHIIFLPWMNKDDLLDVIQESDVVLDPVHFGIGSTAILVYSTTTPMVTWAGEFMRGRVGYAYCQILNINECVASSKEVYADKAFELATNKNMRSLIAEKTKKNDFLIYENSKPINEFTDLLISL